jgi:hypothetical protein
MPDWAVARIFRHAGLAAGDREIALSITYKVDQRLIMLSIGFLRKKPTEVFSVIPEGTV